MIIVADDFLKKAYQHTRSLCYTPEEYLWSIYTGNLQVASETVICTWLYDYYQDSTKAKLSLIDYRLLQEHLPCHTLPISEQGLWITLKEELLQYGLCPCRDILRTVVEEQQIAQGWMSLPLYLPWLKLQTLQPPIIYQYEEINDDLLGHIHSQSNNIAILTDKTNHTLFQACLLAYGMEYDEDISQVFSSDHRLMKLIKLLIIDLQVLEPQALAMLLSVPKISQHCELLQALKTFPKTFCTWIELTHYLKAKCPTGLLWLDTLIALISPHDHLVTLFECKQQLQIILIHVEWDCSLDLLNGVDFFQKHRSYLEWWKLLAHLAGCVNMPIAVKTKIQLVSPIHAFTTPTAVLYIPVQVSCLHVSNTLSLTAAYLLNNIEQDSIMQINRKFEEYTRLAQPIPSMVKTLPQMIPRVETITIQKKVTINWIKTIRSYTLCQRFGWMQHNLPNLYEHATTIGLSNYLRGLLMHAWMHNHSLKTKDFLNKWLKSNAFILLQVEYENLIVLLDTLHLSWQELKATYSYLNDIYSQEETILFERKGFSGKLRIDLIVEHELGLVLIDFKTCEVNLKSLSIHAGLNPQLPLYSMTKDIIGVVYMILQPDGRITCLGLSKEEIGLVKKTHDDSSWQALLQKWSYEIDEILNMIIDQASSPQPWLQYHDCNVCIMKSLCQV